MVILIFFFKITHVHVMTKKNKVSNFKDSILGYFLLQKRPKNSPFKGPKAYLMTYIEKTILLLHFVLFRNKRFMLDEMLLKTFSENAQMFCFNFVPPKCHFNIFHNECTDLYWSKINLSSINLIFLNSDT